MIIGCGPYIGSFEQEILTFMPYSRWLSGAVDYNDIYLNTHKDRMWLYDFIPDDNKIPIETELSKDIKNQRGYINKNLSVKKYQELVKSFRDDIIIKANCNKKDIKLYYLNYIKSCPPYSIYNKIFSSLPVENAYLDGIGKLTYIPHISGDKKLVYKVNDYIKKNYDYIIIGDYDIYLKEFNTLLRNYDGFNNSWKYMINYISKARAVICPLSFWTTICNLQSTPVFSWGEYVGQHKKDGIYYFNNNKSLIVPYNNILDGNKVISMMEYFIKEYI